MLRKEVIVMAHDAPITVHVGMNRTRIKVRDCAFWPDMKAGVESYVAGCETFSRNKHGNKTNKAPLQHT